MDIIIKKAVPPDLPAIAALYGAVCDCLEGKPHNPGWHRDGFPTVSDAEHYLATGTMLLAWEDGELAGSIAFDPSPSAEGEPFPDAPGQEEDIWYIHVLAVHPNHGRRGIGSRLLAEAEEYARHAGVRALRLYVWEGNSPAIRAYEKAGYACIRKGVDIGLAEFGLPRFSLYEKSVSV